MLPSSQRKIQYSLFPHSTGDREEFITLEPDTDSRPVIHGPSRPSAGGASGPGGIRAQHIGPKPRRDEGNEHKGREARKESEYRVCE
jgi:hypothetical protein